MGILLDTHRIFYGYGTGMGIEIPSPRQPRKEGFMLKKIKWNAILCGFVRQLELHQNSSYASIRPTSGARTTGEKYIGQTWHAGGSASALLRRCSFVLLCFHQNSQGCRGDEISIPIPIPYPQKILWVSPQDPHTHRTPKSYIPIPASCIFTTRGLFQFAVCHTDSWLLHDVFSMRKCL